MKKRLFFGSVIIHAIIVIIWLIETLRFTSGKTAYTDIILGSVFFSVVGLALISLIYSIILASKRKEILTAFILPVIPAVTSLFIILLFVMLNFGSLNNWGLIESFMLIITAIFLGIAVIVDIIILIIRRIVSGKSPELLK